MKQILLTALLVFTGLGGLEAQYHQGPPQGRRYPQNNNANDPWAYPNGPGRWDRSWNDRPLPRRGACFFSDTGFRGNRFCVSAGQQLTSLPGDFGDNISSIQVFGNGGGVQIFNDRNFSGGSRAVRRSVADLHNLRFRGGHTWNNRISSARAY